MKKIRTKRGLLGTLMIAAILGTGCNTEQSVPELYVDDNIRETPVTAFTENIEVSKAIEERCKAVLNQDGNTNIAVYSDSADYYAAEGLSYRELLLKRLASTRYMQKMSWSLMRKVTYMICPLWSSPVTCPMMRCRRVPITERYFRFHYLILVSALYGMLIC